jgi:hypothetical protein
LTSHTTWSLGKPGNASKKSFARKMQKEHVVVDTMQSTHPRQPVL